MIRLSLYQRRLAIFAANQNGDSLTFLRELIEHICVADWTTFNKEATACHLFLNSVNCEKAKRAYFKIISKNPEVGDMKSLLTKSIELYPDKEITAKSVVIREPCRTCNYKGHTTKDCSGSVSYVNVMSTRHSYGETKRLMRILKSQKEQRKTRKRIRKRRKRRKKQIKL